MNNDSVSGGSVLSQPRVSVCIAAYKPTFLKYAIDSVLAQKHDNLEILVGDDSAGECLAVVNSYHDERIAYISNVPRLGYGGNTWKLIQRATGSYISLLQHDDMLNPGFFGKMLSAFGRDPKIGVVLCGSSDLSDVVRTRPSSLREGIIEDPIKAVMDNSTRMIFLPSSTLLAAEAAKSHPWPDHGTADLEMYVALALKGWKFWYFREPLVNYRVHSEQLSSNALSHRSSLVSLWSSFTFTSPEHESSRLTLLAKANLALAGALIKSGRAAEARIYLDRAKELLPQVGEKKRIALWAISYLPCLVSTATTAWHKLRNPDVRRHEGF